MLRSRSSRPVVFVVGLAVLTVSALSAAEKVDHEAQCTYKKLSWDDFRGPVTRGQQVAWVASTIVVDPYDIVVEEQADGTFGARMKYVDVYALMDKLSSGVVTGGRDDRNLAHEQLHFDITEIHARRLHARLSDLVINGEEDSTLLRVQLEQEVQLAWEEEMKAFNRHQAEYDGQTANGRKKSQQKKWASRITEELAAEEPYPLR